MKSVFYLKYTLRFSIFEFDLNVKHHSYFFKDKPWSTKETHYRRK